MRIFIKITMFLISHLLCVQSADAIEVLVPDSHVSTVHPRISVVGRSNANAVLLALNQTPIQTLIVSDSIFHVRLTIPYGLNKITLSVADTTAQFEKPVELQVLCGPRIPRSYEKVFGSSLFHGKALRTECTSCHEPPNGADTNDNSGQLCYSCHADIKRRFSTHGVDEDDICTNCHRIESDLSRQTQGVYSDMNPCYLCHTDKIGEFAQDFIHGPVAGGTCTVCHNPHGSQFDNNLVSPMPVLCLYCHTSVAGMDERVIHEPFEDGGCTDCHDPHATGNRWVLLKETGELCIGCHEDDIQPDNHRHPIGGHKPKGDLIAGLTLDNDGRLDCLTCHLPHGSQADYLLRSSDTNGCRECHPEM